MQSHPVVSEETEEVWRQRANPSFLAEFLKPLDGEDHTNIEVRVVVRILELMNDQVIMPGRRGHAEEAEVAERMADIKRAVGLAS